MEFDFYFKTPFCKGWFYLNQYKEISIHLCPSYLSIRVWGEQGKLR